MNLPRINAVDVVTSEILDSIEGGMALALATTDEARDSLMADAAAANDLRTARQGVTELALWIDGACTYRAEFVDGPSGLTRACEYNLLHRAEQVPAETYVRVIYGQRIPACKPCAARLS
ncbi:hypothetical protein [Streptacidiphilus sp. P02-A3a]|uniref:hypothetical protein n=1 Tax=Streptacidiphilus sp. P02-A3a TaxID=2704468 RepID=UPI0015F9A5A7|nr:hypothetical protein [Streptacidiphilus sp. P02-A3a]QMU72118.1 hypothetical protein GXP74_31655 [Streptacidiphilus sp. P02-A3a]